MGENVQQSVRLGLAGLPRATWSARIRGIGKTYRCALWIATAPVAAVLMIWMLVEASYWYDASQYPSLEREYEKVELGMTAAEVHLILGPPYFGSSREPIQGRHLGKEGTLSDQWFSVLRRHYALNHYTGAYIDFDDHDVVIYKRRPGRMGPRYTTLYNLKSQINTKIRKVVPSW